MRRRITLRESVERRWGKSELRRNIRTSCGGRGGESCKHISRRYTSPTANDTNYVHEVTVIDHVGRTGRQAYLAY